MVKLIYIFILFTVFVSQNTFGQPYHIQGQIAGLGNETVYLVDLGQFYHLKDKDIVLDSCVGQGDRFEFSGTVSHASLVAIKVPSLTNQYLQFVLESGDTEIKGSIGRLFGSSVKGGHENENFVKQKQVSSRHIWTRNALADSLSANKANEKRESELRQQYDSLTRATAIAEKQFILDHPTSFASLLLVNNMFHFSQPSDTIEKYLSALDPELLENPDAVTLKDKTRIAQSGVQRMPDFIMPDPDGKYVNSNQYLGKLTVVNFWATWCVPCLEKLPQLKALYNRYSDKINFLSISLDRDRSAWKKTLQNKQIPGDHLCDGQAGRSPTMIGFDIRAIPRLFVFDELGRTLFDSEHTTSSLEDFLEKEMSDQ